MAIDFSNPRFNYTASRVRAYRERNCCGLMEAKSAIRKNIVLEILQELKVPHFYNSHEDRFNELIDVLETLVNDGIPG